MAVVLTNTLGRVEIGDEVISSVAGFAARQCYGIVGVSPRGISDGLAELLGMENVHRGVELRMDGDRVVLNLYVIVEYGVNIFQVARNVMEQVKHQVESLTGLVVEQINVHVQGVRVGRLDQRATADSYGRRV